MAEGSATSTASKSMKRASLAALALASIALVGCSSQPKQFTAVEQRAVDSYVEIICAPAIDDTHAGMQDTFVQFANLSAYHDSNGGDPAQQEAMRIARERGCVS